MLKILAALIVCALPLATPSAQAAYKHHRYRPARVAQHGFVEQSILPHPNGCPRTAFCGCGVAVRVFGAPIRSLWSVANWRNFPRTTPQPGMVAVWPHHVAYIEQIIGDGLAIMFDPNSGRHETRQHVRSLRGAKIVDPHHSDIAWLTSNDERKPSRRRALR
jgi:hypothetical protein